MVKKDEKMFVIRKYIKARSALEAIQIEKNKPVDDVWVDDEWKKLGNKDLASAIGFVVSNDDN